MKLEKGSRVFMTIQDICRTVTVGSGFEHSVKLYKTRPLMITKF